jgi:hypothetical protein
MFVRWVEYVILRSQRKFIGNHLWTWYDFLYINKNINEAA